MNQKLTKGGHTSHLPLHTSNRGITLIALVITIIVLLILAGVTINMVLGDDGIIQNAQKAKERYEDEAEKEQDALDIAAGNLDLHTKETVANTVKVGDYVEYSYNPGTVEITAEESGLQKYAEDRDDESYAVSQKYSSSISTDAEDGSKAAQVTAWRVLSKKDGIVKLISEEPVSSLTLYGAMGYLNGPTVLNDMCKTLYSSDIGTGRSINVEDINEITKYDGTKYYCDYDSDEKKIPADETRTIGEAAKTAGKYGAEYDMDDFASEVPEEGKNIVDYEITSYHYDVVNGSYTNQWLTAEDKEYQMLFGEGELYFWLATSFVNPHFNGQYVGFGVRCVEFGYVSERDLFSSFATGIYPEYAIRPVVTLKTGLEIDTTDATRDGSASAPYQIKGN